MTCSFARKVCLEHSGDMVATKYRGQKNILYNFAYTTDNFKEEPGAYTISGLVSAEACELCGRIALRIPANG